MNDQMTISHLVGVMTIQGCRVSILLNKHTGGFLSAVDPIHWTEYLG